MKYVWRKNYGGYCVGETTDRSKASWLSDENMKLMCAMKLKPGEGPVKIEMTANGWKRVEPPAEAVPIISADCRECGQGVKIDEDGCCAHCGADATIHYADGVSVPPETDWLAKAAMHLKTCPRMPPEGADDMVIAVEKAIMDQTSVKVWMSERETCLADRENLKAELAEAREIGKIDADNRARDDELIMSLSAAYAASIGKLQSELAAQKQFDNQLRNELEIAGRAHIEEIKGLVQEQELAQARERNANLVTQELASGDETRAELAKAREWITMLEASRSDNLNDPDQIARLEAKLAKTRERIDWLENARGLAITARDEALRQLAARAMPEALRLARQQRDIARFNEDALRERLSKIQQATAGQLAWLTMIRNHRYSWVTEDAIMLDSIIESFGANFAQLSGPCDRAGKGVGPGGDEICTTQPFEEVET